MCGIIGIMGQAPVAPLLLDGLKRLEYRGYDSAGVATLVNGRIERRRAEGKLVNLRNLLDEAPVQGTIGIGHTRWATHGRPSDINAHPHRDCQGRVVVIHNGIVENYPALKERLVDQGHTFVSETDTEVIPHLIEHYLQDGTSLELAVGRAIGQMEGAHAMVVFSVGEPDKLVAARVGNAGGVVVGYGQGEMFVASDLPALLPHTRQVVFLADGEIVAMTSESVSYLSVDGAVLTKEAQAVSYDPLSAARGNYKHFMLKEIAEQPEAILDSIRGRARFEPPAVVLEDVAIPKRRLSQIRRVVLVGMGTSLHAAMVGRHYIEQIARIPAEVDNASEFRYRKPLLGGDTLVVSVGQSGETVDSLAAMDEARRYYANIITPLGASVLKVLDAVETLDLRFVAPGHGIIWRKNIPAIIKATPSMA